VTTLAPGDRGTKSHVLLDSRTSYSSSIARFQWGSTSTLWTEVGIEDNVGGVGAARVTSHGDGAVDRRSDARGLRRGGQMSSLVHQGGSVNCEAEVVRGADEDIRATCGTGLGAGATCSAASGSEVPAIDEG
jgi:hypothetical protein